MTVATSLTGFSLNLVAWIGLTFAGVASAVQELQHHDLHLCLVGGGKSDHSIAQKRL